MQLDEFKVRASSARKFMSASQRKADLFGKTCLGVVDDWVKEQVYERKGIMVSKYTQKGTIKEGEAIQFAARVHGWEIAIKNEKRFEDAYFTGTPDLILPDLVADIKCSWDHKTFPLIADEIPSDEYYDQLQVYMHMTGVKNAKLIYCLMNAPEFMIERQARNLMYELGEEEVSEELYNKVKAEMTYEHLSDDVRIKVFDVEYNPLRIAEIQTKVSQMRPYVVANIQPKLDKINL